MTSSHFFALLRTSSRNTRPPPRATLEKLRSIITEIAPHATSGITWGMPFFEIEGKADCALGAHKSHVNLVLAGPFTDPDGLLQGDGKTGRRLVLTELEEIPVAKVETWLREGAAAAKQKA